jgi:tetratricopeptide (TPR) repeat protein
VPPRRGPLRLVPGLLVAAAALGILALLVLSSVRVTSGIDSVPTPTVAFLLPYSDTQIAQFNRAAESTGSFQAWAAYGTALFDNLQTLRENAPQSPQYRNQVARWLEVIAAYDRALALQDNVVIRADRAVAAFNYGTDASSQAYVEQALAEVERGIAANESEPRALLNYGLILVLNDPPRTEEALAQWRRIIEVAPDAPEAQSAQVLLESYGAGE